MTPEQENVINELREQLKEELTTTIRQRREEQRAAYEYFFATSPRISLGEHFEPADHVASFAAFDPGSYDAAKVIAAELLENGQPLPERLAGFVAQVLRGLERPKTNQGKRGNTDLRNETLAFAVWRLEIEGIHPTKANESVKLCGCDIVADLYDELLANDIEGTILKPKGGEFSRATMREIWLKDPDIKIWKQWQSCLPE